MTLQSGQQPHATSFRYSSVVYSEKDVCFLKGNIRHNYYALKKDTPVKRSIDTCLENEIFRVKKGVKRGDTVFQIPPKFLNPDRTYILFQFSKISSVRMRPRIKSIPERLFP